MKLASITILLACICCSATAQENWLFSFSSGSGSANTLSSNNQSSVQFNGDDVYHFVANHYDSASREGANLYYEFFLSQSNLVSETTGESSIDIEGTHLQFGGAYEWSDFQLLKPYIAATLGTSYYDSSTRSGEPFWSGSFGVGSRYQLNPRISLKLEARAIGTVLEGDLGVFCEGEDCSLGIDGDIWWQQHITAGFSWSF